jgi:hypothetical protein
MITGRAQDGPMHVIYDSRTGSILGSYRQFDLTAGQYVAVPAADLLDSLRETLDAETAAVVAVVEAPADQQMDIGRQRVDPDKGQLVPKLELRLSADRTQLNGDGKDSVDLAIAVLDSAGAPVKGFAGELLVQTSRGRLSTPGGRLEAVGGAASLTLTAPAETVNKVRVTVSDPTNQCMAGSLDLEFL